MQTPTPITMQDLTKARALVLSAFQSYGTDALDLANEARALVGIDALDVVAVGLADDGETEQAWQLRGAIAALTGKPVPEVGGEYEDEAAEGFWLVESAGFLGEWE